MRGGKATGTSRFALRAAATCSIATAKWLPRVTQSGRPHLAQKGKPSLLPTCLRQMSLSIAVSIFLVTPAHAEITNELIGYAVVVDGDTLEIEGSTVHLFGIDAPELMQFCEMDKVTLECGKRAYVFLAAHIGNRVVHCSRRNSDQIQGLVAVCKVGDEDLAQWLVSHGHALAYRRYSDDYLSAERDAIKRRVGLWRWPRSFVPPWQWREQHAYLPEGVAADLDDRLRAPVRRVIELLVDKDYHQLARLTDAGSLYRESHISRIEGAITKSRHVLVMPPEVEFERMPLIEIPNSTPKRWRTEIPLWDREQGELTLLLTIGLMEREDQFDVIFFDVTDRQGRSED